MGSFSKTLRKYERRILLGLVILLLVSFTVLGVVDCQGQTGPGVEYGGSFQATPTKRTTISDEAFRDVWGRFERFRGRFGSPSIAYMPYLAMGREPVLAGPAGVWAHLCETEAGRAVGYACGEQYQKKVTVRDIVQGATGGLTFNDATYDRFLRDMYGGAARDFEKTVAEMVVKDQFLRPLIDTQRYGIPYEQAYEAWKKRAEYVDLEYVALRGRDFALYARQVETTRGAIDEIREPVDAAVATAGSVHSIERMIRKWADEHDGAVPTALADLPFPAERGLPQDAWLADYRYVVEDGRALLSSAGPDGAFGTADDIDGAFVADLRARTALGEAGLGLEAWRRRNEAWPESLAKLLEAPAGGGRPVLPEVRKDGWENDLVYRLGEDGTPHLASAGPDGQPDTADDIVATLEDDKFVVGPGGLLAPFVDASRQDAWGNAFRIRLGMPSQARWDVVSAGPDGAFDTDDDIRSGNRSDLFRFYERPEVRSDYLVPAKRKFQAIYVHLPLVPDDVLRALWAAFPEQHPDEYEAFQRWREYHPEPYYRAEDPADPENGHGAELARRLAPGATPTLVPDVTIFGDAPEDLVAFDSPDRDPYLEGGWRAILLREQFLENVMNHLLAMARESQGAVVAWDEAKAAFDAGEGEDPGAKPTETTFESLLANELAPFLPGEGQPAWFGLVAPAEAIAREVWEADENIGDIGLTVAGLSPLSEPGQYGAVPVILNGTLSKAIVRNLELVSERQPELDEVRDDVFERYLASRRIALAAQALARLKQKVGANSEGDAWQAAVDEWKASLDVAAIEESTGLFVGSEPPRTSSGPADLSEEARQRAQRRDFVRQRGYETVRASAAGSSPVGEGAGAGTVGRTVLRDDGTDGTDAVYLVRVKDRQFPPPEAFSPQDYAGYLTFETLGSLLSRGSNPDAPRMGILPKALHEYFGDLDALRRKFQLRTETELEAR